jgi:hypothetical protein
MIYFDNEEFAKVPTGKRSFIVEFLDFTIEGVNSTLKMTRDTIIHFDPNIAPLIFVCLRIGIGLHNTYPKQCTEYINII